MGGEHSEDEAATPALQRPCPGRRPERSGGRAGNGAGGRREAGGCKSKWVESTAKMKQQRQRCNEYLIKTPAVTPAGMFEPDGLDHSEAPDGGGSDG
jgi:hypothetical protein